MDVLKSASLAFVAALFCIGLLRPLAIRLGLVDVPDGRKQHAANVPLIGGIAIFFGFCFALLSMNMSLLPYRGMIAGSTVLVLMGVVDDFRELDSRLRLCGQLLAVLFLIFWGHVELNQLGDILFLGPIALGFWSVPVTLLLVMTNLNAVNMIDGQDGLAGGVGLGQALLLAWVALQLDQQRDFQLLMVLVALLLAFLLFNMPVLWRKQASIFLGDAGSTLIAFLLAWFAITLSQSDVHTIYPIALLWIMAFPLFDLLNVVIHRFQKRRSVFLAGRDHIHHVLQVAGVSASISTFLLCLFSFLLGVLGIVLARLGFPEAWQFMLFLVIMLVYCLLVALSRQSESSVC